MSTRWARRVPVNYPARIVSLLAAWLGGGGFLPSIWAQTPEVLWSQPPGYLVMTNSPPLRGGGRFSNLDWESLSQTAHFTPPNAVVADDFRGDGRPIRSVRWWGSYQAGYEPAVPDGPFEEGFVLSFFGSAPSNSPALPGRLLATYLAPLAAVQAVPLPFTNAQGRQIFQYDLAVREALLDHGSSTQARPYGFRTATNAVYWLSVAAEAGLRVQAATNETGLITNWLRQATGKRGTNDFWAWQSAPAPTGAAPASGPVEMIGTNWFFPTNQWLANGPIQGEFDQAFELTGGCPAQAPRLLSITADCEVPMLTLVFDSTLDLFVATDPFVYLLNGTIPWVGVISEAQDVVTLIFNIPLPPGVYTLAIDYLSDSCSSFALTAPVSFTIACPPPPPPEAPPALSFRLLDHISRGFGPTAIAVLAWDQPDYRLEFKSSLQTNVAWAPFAATSPALDYSPKVGQRFFRLKRVTP